MLWLLPGNLEFPMTAFQWVRRRVTIMAGIIDPDQQKYEVGLPSHAHTEEKGRILYSQGNPFRYFLADVAQLKQ